MASPPCTQLPQRPTIPLASPPGPPHRLHHATPSPTFSSPSQKSPSLASTHQQSYEALPLPRDVISWTSAIGRHARKGRLSDAVAAFSRMLSSDDVRPNAITLVTLLSACADTQAALPLGRALHAHALKWCPGGAESDVVLGTALLDMYASCGCADLARVVFDRMASRNAVCCNTMIAGHMRSGEVDRALVVFCRMPSRDRVSWTVLIDGCVKNGLLEEALAYFQEMLRAHNIAPDYVTVVAVLAACADLGALGQGLWVHLYVLRRPHLWNNSRVRNSLIDVYSRCGRVDFAHQMFQGMLSRTLVSWNSIIMGFAINGCSIEALEHFEMMQRAGFKPDGVSFTGALTACSHCGLVDEGLKYYEAMQSAYGIQPRVEHYGCVVDLLGRAGRLEDAMSVVEGMPMRPNEVVLGALLAACRMHNDVHLAERLMEYLVELEPDTDSNYVLLSNIYAAAGRWDGVGEVRNMMKALGVRKRPGFSAVEIGAVVHEFIAGDKSHPQSDDIYDMLGLLRLQMKVYGYHSTSL